MPRRYRIRILNDISPRGLERLPQELYELHPDPDAFDAVLVRSASLHGAPLAPSLLAVARAGAGVNNIPVAELSRRGVPVFNAPGANANAVKELVLAGLLLAARNICAAWQFTRSLEGDDASIETAVEAGKKRFAGFELPGRTLGVIGLGAIGVQVANSALALGMRVLGYDPQITVQRAWQLSSAVEQALSLDDLFARSGAVTLHVPLDAQTRGLVNERRLKLMQPGGVILNFARAEIVDVPAILGALEEGHLHGYVCDFPSKALKDHPGVVTLPHIGASTSEAEENCAVMVIDTLRDFLENGNVRHSVNFPDAAMPRAAGTARLTVANLNIPNMVGQISTRLAHAGLNIADMLNMSRGEYAYTIIDTSDAVGPELLGAIGQIEGVLAARLI
jgi:D-3-phosphoglycerate dehydrogenase